MKKTVEPACTATLFAGEIAVRDWRLTGILIVLASVVFWLLFKTKVLEHMTPILAAMPATCAPPVL